MLLLEAKIPEFLQSSPYLQSLLSNGPFPEEGLEIPDGSGKQDLTVTSKADLIELLSTLRFWLVPEVAEQSSDLLRFAFLPKFKIDFVEVATHFRNDIPLIDELFQIVNSDEEHRLKMAAGFGLLSVLQCVHVQGTKVNKDVMQAAASGGHFDCLKYLKDHILTKDGNIEMLACNIAAEHGHISCVKKVMQEWGSTCITSAVVGAAKGNHMEILTYACSVGHNQSCVIAAMKICAGKGHLECLEYLHSLGYEKDENLMSCSARKGHLNCLKFLFEHSYSNDEDVCCCAAEYGHLECLKYAHEKGMPWDESTCLAAAEGGYLECLQYAREHGCPWWDGPAVADLPVNSRNIHCTNRIRVAEDIEVEDEELIAASACWAPTIDCLLYVLEQGAALSPACATNSTGSKALATLQFLHARGFTWEAEDCEDVIFSGSLDCLRFLHDICTPWDRRKLIQNDSPEYAILEYLRSQACPCITAAKCGNLESLQYAHEHGDPLTSEVCRQAATIECYGYAVAHGCPGAELNTQFRNQITSVIGEVWHNVKIFSIHCCCIVSI